MATLQTESLSALYEQDETAWLDIMSHLVAEKRFSELDYRHLSEYLSDMARCDRREVQSRLVAILCYMLKWEYQIDHQTDYWQSAMRHQRFELRLLLESATLKKHASDILPEAFNDARKRAASETGQKTSKFIGKCPWTIEELLCDD